MVSNLYRITGYRTYSRKQKSISCLVCAAAALLLFLIPSLILREFIVWIKASIGFSLPFSIAACVKA